MKTIILALAFSMVSVAQASTFDCSLTNGQPNDTGGISYSFDTEAEDNVFLDLGNGTHVGCVVLRAKPELVTCGLGRHGKFSVFVTADTQTALLGLDSESRGKKVSLKCVRRGL